MAACFVSLVSRLFLSLTDRESKRKLKGRQQQQLLQADQDADESEKDGNNSEYDSYTR